MLSLSGVYSTRINKLNALTEIKHKLFDIEDSSKMSKHLLQLNTLTESEILILDNRDYDSGEEEFYHDDPSDDDHPSTASFENVQSTTYSGVYYY